jgi:hypothetical protein
MDEQSDLVQRALRYPYAIPERSFVQVAERTLQLGEVEVDLDRRAALLAYGANAAPEALARKLAGNSDPLPVLRATLSDFDVVYSAHVSAYGSVPATLRHSPGTEVDLFVIYPTEGQLQLISKTEPNYALQALNSPCRLADGVLAEDLRAFFSRHGRLLVGGSEVALAAISARGRRLPEMTQPEILEWLRAALRPDRGLKAFVVECAAGEVSLGDLP